MGFAQKSAKRFFELIRKNRIDILLDIRLNNKSQLVGFTKGDDLQYFLNEMCQCQYKHCLEYAPTKEILDAFKNKEIGWSEYTEQYIKLMSIRGNYREFAKEFADYENICLLCSEPVPEYCHRRLIAEMIAKSNTGIIINHI